MTIVEYVAVEVSANVLDLAWLTFLFVDEAAADASRCVVSTAGIVPAAAVFRIHRQHHVYMAVETMKLVSAEERTEALVIAATAAGEQRRLFVVPYDCWRLWFGKEGKIEFARAHSWINGRRCVISQERSRRGQMSGSMTRSEASGSGLKMRKRWCLGRQHDYPSGPTPEKQ